MAEPYASSQDETVGATVCDRRAFVRYAADGLTAACRPTGVKDVGWLATVRDVSPGGIGLFLRHRFRPGTPLVIELRRANGTLLREARVCVIYAVPLRTEDDFAWRVGCAFVTELSEEEVQSLLL